MSRIEFDEEDENEFRTPSRRGTYSKFDPDGVASAIPTPGGSAIPAPVSRRQSAGQLAGRRASNGALREGARSRGQKLSDLGETY
jgi:hypothetical protein